MASSVTELGSARFQRAEGPGDLSPRDALIEALRRFDSGELAPDHVIVIYGSAGEEEQQCGYMQAGRIGLYTRIGILERVRDMMFRSADQ
jgi:hypothetical protein